MNAKPATVDEYLASVPDDAREALEGLRRAVPALVPGAVEVFGYGMPGFKYRGRPLIYFAVWRNHCALYGFDVRAHQDALAAYDTSNGTIRFPPAEPLPEALLTTLVNARVAAIESARVARKPRTARASTSV